MPFQTLFRKLAKHSFPFIFATVITMIAAAQTVTFTPIPLAFSGIGKAVDFNNDGREDFILPNGTSFSVLLSNGDGTYVQMGPFAMPANASIQSVAYGDFNGDGFADIMFVGDDNAFATHLYEFLNNGDGTFHLQATFDAVVSQIVTGDFNHDGKIDLAFFSNLGTSPVITVWFGNGDGGFTPGPSTPLGGPDGQLYVGDFDGDGNADLASVYIQPSSDQPAEVRVLYGDSTGHFTVARACCDDRELPHPADVNGDGITDLIGTTCCSNTAQASLLNVYYGSRSRTFTKVSTPLAGRTLLSTPTVFDLNGDGIPDLVLKETDSSGSFPNNFPWFLSVKLGNGDGTYQPEQQIYSSNFFFSDPVVMRANLDTKPDLVIQQASNSTTFSGSTVIFLNTSTGNFPTCQAPNALTGIQVCSPGATAASSPVHFGIGASGQTPMRKVEVWVDGVKNTESLKNFSQYAFLDADIALASGTHTIEVFAAGWDNLLQHSSFSLAVAAPTPNFTIAATPATATIRAGRAASYTVNVGAQNGFTGPVTFACSGLPRGAVCVFNPNPLTVTGAGSTSVLQITTTGAVASLLAPSSLSPARSENVFALLASGSFGVFGLVFMTAGVSTRRKQSKYIWAMLAIMVVMMLMVVGCGGGSSAMTTTPPTGGTAPPVVSNVTPTGTYTVTVTGTSGSVQHATTAQLVVQ